MNTFKSIVGVILAGGRATRMGGQDKGLIDFNNQPLVAYAIQALQPVVDSVVINANRNLETYQCFGLSVVCDQTDSFDGPLAGALAVMACSEADAIVVMPCDCPLIKTQHVKKLLAALAETEAEVAVAYDGRQMHPVFFAATTVLQHNLRDYLAAGQRKVAAWITQQRFVLVDFSRESDILANMNTQNDLTQWQVKIEG